jgi:hypothetical protein
MANGRDDGAKLSLHLSHFNRSPFRLSHCQRSYTYLFFWRGGVGGTYNPSDVSIPFRIYSMYQTILPKIYIKGDPPVHVILAVDL